MLTKSREFVLSAALVLLLGAPVSAFADASELIFKQKLDHANPADTRVFDQHYFIDSSNAQGDHAPVFLYICGEEGNCGGRVFRGVMVEAAQKFHGHMIALEHRFYGQSKPFAELTTENLATLSLESALEDLASFIRAMKADPKLSGSWVSIGGSYSGTVSAFLREKHPELIVGALASSAPVYSKFSFTAYDAHLAEVAGPVCRHELQGIVSDVEARMADPGQKDELRKLFAAEDLTDDGDFLYWIADMTASAIQYGYKDKLCQTVHAQPTVEGYASMVAMMAKDWGITAKSTSVEGAMLPTPSENRAWFYQLCTQFAGWQDANPDREMSVRSVRIGSAYDQRACQRLFGIAANTNMKARNQEYFYPLLDPAKASNIFFTDGSDDPWSMLSYANHRGQRDNPAVRTFLVEGGSHSSDLASKSPNAIQAREAFLSWVAEWLK